MPSDVAFEEVNEAKASMGQIYNEPDLRELRKLGYTILGLAKPIF